MSFFDRQGIPKDKEALMVQSQEEEIRDSIRQKGDGIEDSEKYEDENEDIKDSSTSEASGDDVFEEAVDQLRSYLFVSLSNDETSFEMHGLVQLATRKWLAMHGEDEKWKAQFSRNLNAVLPTGDHENWARCEMLFPHVKSAERQRPRDDRSVQEWAQILQKAGWYAWARGDYREAERMCKKSAEALIKVLGREDIETSYSLGMLALTYRYQGRWKEAEELNVQVMETSLRVLGQEHLDTLTSMNNLALTFWNQGRWKEAEELNVQVMETRKRVLGQKHPDTLTSMNNLAFMLEGQGKKEEAIKLMAECVQLCNQVLGAEHPNTRSSVAALAKWQSGKVANEYRTTKLYE
jgi:tetratricopeptide (TPR) repeat protein